MSYEMNVLNTKKAAGKYRSSKESALYLFILWSLSKQNIRMHLCPDDEQAHKIVYYRILKKCHLFFTLVLC